MAKARAEVRNEIEQVFQTILEESKQRDAVHWVPGDERTLLRHFISYAKSLYVVFAGEIGEVVDSPDDCRNILRDTLPWAVALKIVPNQEHRVTDLDGVRREQIKPIYGDWYQLVNEALTNIDLSQYTMNIGSLQRGIHQKFRDPIWDPQQNTHTKTLHDIHDAVSPLAESEFAKAMNRRRDLAEGRDTKLAAFDSRPDHPSWDEVRIKFLSDERLQIWVGDQTQNRNYSGMGFEDRRNGTPNESWKFLRQLAEEGGFIRDVEAAGIPWPKAEKRIQEIRQKLKTAVAIDSDPFFRAKDRGYRTRFRIECGASYRT